MKNFILIIIAFIFLIPSRSQASLRSGCPELCLYTFQSAFEDAVETERLHDLGCFALAAGHIVIDWVLWGYQAASETIFLTQIVGALGGIRSMLDPLQCVASATEEFERNLDNAADNWFSCMTQSCGIDPTIVI